MEGNNSEQIPDSPAAFPLQPANGAKISEHACSSSSLVCSLALFMPFMAHVSSISFISYIVLAL
jgi:hypothetical protein